MNMIPYKFLCDTKVFYSIPDLPYKVVGPTLARVLDRHFTNLNDKKRT